jgi:hypothetical protein
MGANFTPFFLSGNLYGNRYARENACAGRRNLGTQMCAPVARALAWAQETPLFASVPGGAAFATEVLGGKHADIS